MLKRQRSVIGYPLQEVAEYRLREGIDANYPSMTADCNGPEDRFAVEPAFNGSAKYLVKDRELGLEYSLDPDLLREPDFNIVEWYRMQLEGSGIYNSLYLAETLEFIETTRIELNSVSETLSDGLLIRHESNATHVTQPHLFEYILLRARRRDGGFQ